jgi:UPF0755 protein
LTGTEVGDPVLRLPRPFGPARASFLRLPRPVGSLGSAGEWTAGVSPRGPLMAPTGLSLLFSLVLLALSGCSSAPEGPPVELTVPAGASFREVVDTLHARGLVSSPRLFRGYARLRGHDRRVHAGQYVFPPGASWSRLLGDLTVGRVVTETLTIPEGFTLKQMAPRIALITRTDADSVVGLLHEDSADTRWDVPGPGLEGYLFPDTYRFAAGIPVAEVLRAMVSRYREVWTTDRVARLDSLGMTEGEVVTLASIVQAEARLQEEMPLVASVFHNRLQLGYPLQADPTVLYALGGNRPRLLYAAMDSVADHPYNTYTHQGLPPGPIGAPGLAALDAVLDPADTDFLYFVAHPDGSHVFSSTLADHNRAVAETRKLWERARRERDGG